MHQYRLYFYNFITKSILNITQIQIPKPTDQAPHLINYRLFQLTPEKLSNLAVFRIFFYLTKLESGALNN